VESAPAAAGKIVVLGESIAVDDFALAGATVVHAADPDAVRHAWATLPADTAVVIVSATAAAVLGAAVDGRAGVLTIAMSQ
jgi:vacuolar-type H+-ATPase subunit F/Vma7